MFAPCRLTTAYQDIRRDRLKPFCEPEPRGHRKPEAQDHTRHRLDPALGACERRIKMSCRNGCVDRLFKKFSESRRASVIYFKCHSPLRAKSQASPSLPRTNHPAAVAKAAPHSSPPPPRGSLASEVQRMEFYFSPERSGREGMRPSPSYRFCRLLSEPATSIQEQTQQQNRPATLIYTA